MEPPQRRAFVNAWDEIVYNLDHASYWLDEQENRNRAKPFVKRLRSLLATLPPDDPAIVNTRARLLIAEYDGCTEDEIACTEKLAWQLPRLLEVWPECPDYDSSDIGAVLLDLVSVTTKAEQYPRALKAAKRLRRHVREHGWPAGVDVDSVHFDLLQVGIHFHEERRHKQALELFFLAEETAPDCPAVAYNIANDLQILGRDDEAKPRLEKLLARSDKDMRQACPGSSPSPRSFRLDALFLMFFAVLRQTGDWDLAYPYAEKHLAERRRGLPSAWSRREVLREIESARRQSQF